MSPRIRSQFSIVALLLLAAGMTANAQQDNPPPKPPVREYLPLITGPDQQDQDTQSAPTQTSPDENPLTGAETFTLGHPELQHSYWVYGFQFQNAFLSNQQTSSGTGNWTSTSYFLGTSSLLKSWGRSEFSLNYSGGGALHHSNTTTNNYYQQAALSQAFHWRRWQLQFFDQFSYLSLSSLGFGGVGGISTPGVGGTLGGGVPNLQTNFLPGQSIFTSNSAWYGNQVTTQAEYLLSRRSSLTGVGSFGIMRLTQANAVDTNDAIFSLGYDYRVSPRDTLGVQYRYMAFRYPGNPQAYNDHAAMMAYGRRITGKLGLQLFGGAEVTIYRHPVGTATGQTGFSGGATLRYSFHRAGFSLTYYHGLSEGSGILAGSNQDQISAQIWDQLSRHWQANIGSGYARNASVGSVPIASGTNHFNSWFASGGLSRMLGRTASFNFNYTFAYQNLSQPLCPTASCGSNFTQHQIWVGLQWHARPLVIH